MDSHSAMGDALAHPFKLIATVTSGLEFVAAKEVAHKFNVTVFEDRKILPGRILFSFPSLDEELMRSLTKLQTVEHLYALVGQVPFESFRKQVPDKDSSNEIAESTPSEVTEISKEEKQGEDTSTSVVKEGKDEEKVETPGKRSRNSEKKNKDNKRRRTKGEVATKEQSANALEELKTIFGKLPKEDWENALSFWKTYQRAIRGIKNLELLNSPMYRVTLRSAGSPLSDTREVLTVLAESLHLQFPSWRPSTKAYEIELFIYCRFDTLYVGISLTYESVSLKQVDKSRAFGATPLRPAIAYSLALLAEIKDGDVIVDPMAGCGTIPQLACQQWPQATFFAGDNFPAAIQKTNQNQALLKKSKGFCDVFQWDARHLPFLSNTIDAIVTDMPFGKRIGSHKDNITLYPALLEEFHRVLKPNGRAILLTAESRLIRQTITSSTWIDERRFTINQGGLDVTIFVLRKVCIT